MEIRPIKFKNTIVTLGHNRKTHRAIIQAVIIFEESYNFPESYVS
jgi:hypothetical protein